MLNEITLENIRFCFWHGLLITWLVALGTLLLLVSVLFNLLFVLFLGVNSVAHIIIGILILLNHIWFKTLNFGNKLILAFAALNIIRLLGNTVRRTHLNLLQCLRRKKIHLFLLILLINFQRVIHISDLSHLLVLVFKKG